ncbi:MAG: NIL domain-containing protein [Bacillota bacterium]
MRKLKLLLSFPQNIVNKAITCEIITRYGIYVNILHADIGISKKGKMILEISGTDKSIEEALGYLNENNVAYKELSESIFRKEEECVHCGACTGICPSEALHFNRNEWSVELDKEKCLLCSLCVRACPVRAIAIGDDFWDV